MEDCGKCFTRGFLIVFNILFVLLGLGFIIAGAIFKFGTDLVKDEVARVLKEIPTDIVGDVALGNILNSLAIVFLAVGAIMLVIGALGCCGACCKTRPLLVAYAIVVALILIAQIVGVALFFSLKSDFNKYVNTGFGRLFEKYTTKADDDLSRSVDGLFHLMECCGLNSSADITKQSGWDPSGKNYKVPQGCCKVYDLGTKDTSSTDMQACLTNPNPDNSYMNTGCYQKLDDLISKYSDIFIGVGITVLIVELLCVMFAFCVCCEIGRDSMV